MNTPLLSVLTDLRYEVGSKLGENSDSIDYDQGFLDGLEKAIEIAERHL